MRPLSLLARLAGGLLLLAGAACIDDPPTAATGAPVGLALSIAGSAVQDANTILVRPFFFHRETEARVELPVTPGDFAIPAPGAENRVTVRLDACFRDGVRLGDAGPYCRLQVQLLLLGAEGDTLVSETQEVDVNLGDPGPIRVPSFGLREPGDGTIGGVVRHAVTNEPIAGATVNLFAGSTPTNTPAATQTTGATGEFAFSVAAGTYLIQVRASGIISGSFGPVTVAEGETVSSDLVLSPTLETGQWRMVLTWGASPSDLDTHLFGPASADDYHVCWRRMDARPYAVLDRDFRNPFGSETATILELAPGRHVYAIFDYTETPSGLAGSNARVRVLRGDTEVAAFDVPDQPGTLWTVFALEGTTITPINTMTEASDEPRHPNLPGSGTTCGVSLSVLDAGGSAKRVPSR